MTPEFFEGTGAGAAAWSDRPGRFFTSLNSSLGSSTANAAQAIPAANKAVGESVEVHEVVAADVRRL